MADGEDLAGRARRRIRTDARTEQSRLIGFEAQSGEETAWTGDDDAPYTGPLGKASSDAVAGLTTEPDGANQRFALDSLGRLWLAGMAPLASQPLTAVVSRYSSAALENQATISTTPAKPLALRMIVPTGGSADTYLMVFDSTVAVVNGAVPLWRALLPNAGVNGGEAAETFDMATFDTTAGLVVAMSTTAVTLTLAGASALFEVLYSATT